MNMDYAQQFANRRVAEAEYAAHIIKENKMTETERELGLQLGEANAEIRILKMKLEEQRLLLTKFIDEEIAELSSMARGLGADKTQGGQHDD